MYSISFDFSTDEAPFTTRVLCEPLAEDGLENKYSLYGRDVFELNGSKAGLMEALCDEDTAKALITRLAALELREINRKRRAKSYIFKYAYIHDEGTSGFAVVEALANNRILREIVHIMEEMSFSAHE